MPTTTATTLSNSQSPSNMTTDLFQSQSTDSNPTSDFFTTLPTTSTPSTSTTPTTTLTTDLFSTPSWNMSETGARIRRDAEGKTYLLD